MGFAVCTVVNKGYLRFFLKLNPSLSFLGFSQQLNRIIKKERKRKREKVRTFTIDSVKGELGHEEDQLNFKV